MWYFNSWVDRVIDNQVDLYKEKPVWEYEGFVLEGIVQKCK